MKYRLRKNELIEDLYIQVDGSWGPWRTARKFYSQSAVEKYAKKNGIEIYGIF